MSKHTGGVGKQDFHSGRKEIHIKWGKVTMEYKLKVPA